MTVRKFEKSENTEFYTFKNIPRYFLCYFLKIRLLSARFVVINEYF